MIDNIVKAVFGARRRVKTRALTRQDFGVILQFVAAELPDTFQVHFANTDQNTGTAKTAIGTRNDGVIVPQEFCKPARPFMRGCLFKVATAAFLAMSQRYRLTASRQSAMRRLHRNSELLLTKLLNG